MIVNAGEIVPGEFFMAADGQVRKVARIAIDAGGRTRVWYQCKPVRLPAEPLLFGHGHDNAPLLEVFAEECLSRISPRQLAQLRESGILLEHE